MVTAAVAFHELAAARAWGLTPAQWYREPAWSRSAMVAHERLGERLRYWSAEWARGRGLPPVKILPG